MVARMRSDREFHAWCAWTGAQLNRVEAKKFPKLPEFLRAVRGEKQRQSRAEQIAAAYNWHAVMQKRNKG